MVIKIGDRVFAKTPLIRCAILGTITQDHDHKVNVKFDHPIKGRISCWVDRSACKPVHVPDHVEVRNRALKKNTTSIIEKLETE